MKAVILAGGRGERLRPITDTRPKPLVPILARPVMDYCLALLAHHGVDEAAVTTHYLAHQIRRYYGESAFGVRLSYTVEDTPLGTAGGVKKVADFLAGEDVFIVMSGDALCDFDLSRAAAFHKEKDADVTIILSSVKTPLEYGVVLSDTMERIFAFSEKPDWSETFSDQVNTGVYLLSPRVLERVPDDTPFDFAHDLFPLLLREGYSLFGYKDDGYWCDIGKIPSLYRCSRDLLQGKAQSFAPLRGSVQPGSDGKAPVFIAHEASVESGALVQDYSVLSPGVKVKKGSRVTASIVLDNARLEEGSVADGAILCEDSVLGENAVVRPGSVIGAQSRLDKGAGTDRGQILPVRSHLVAQRAFEEEGFLFTEEGAAVGDAPGLSDEQADRLGGAFARTFAGEVLVMWDENKKSSAGHALYFAAGVMRGGQNALLLGEGNRELLSFASHKYRLPGVYVSDGGNKGLYFVFARDGIPLTRREVLQLSRLAEQPSDADVKGSLLRRGDITEAYVEALVKEMGDGAGATVAFRGPRAKLVSRAAEKAGFSVYSEKRDHIFQLEVYPQSLKLYFDGEHLGATEKIRLFLIEEAICAGQRNFVLPRFAPAFFSEHIRSRGGSVETVSLGHTSFPEKAARENAAKQRFLFDTSFLAARLLRTISAMNPQKLCERLRAAPEIYVSELFYYPSEENKAKLLGFADTLFEESEKVRLDPGFFGIRIVSEAFSFEAALDHAFETRGKLNEIEKNIRGSNNESPHPSPLERKRPAPAKTDD